MYEILKTVESPKDIKRLTVNELRLLAEDIREGLFNRLTKIGGHFGPNFGIVEITIALHYVFNSPEDKFVFDVSHQCYPHKMLTGRKKEFIIDEFLGTISGYTDPAESDHDIFKIGHTSTSVALANGLVKARDILGGKENIIAVIGDGSLSGGEALEALNVAGSELNSNLIIIANDNEQSISETHGGLYKSLKELRDTKGTAQNNIFKSFGLDYIYEENGNDIASLISLFKRVKDIKHPIVLHIKTQKGKGYKLAEENKEAWHWTPPFDKETGEKKSGSQKEDYTAVAKDIIMKKAKSDPDFLVITPNMPMSFGLGIKEREILGKQFVDVGIAEEQAIALASGAAKRGAKPLVLTNMTFMQRSYDQISHDLCLNSNPAVILLNACSPNSVRDATHSGIFGIPMLSNIPNLLLLCPTSKNELSDMLLSAIDYKESPVAILMPSNAVDYRESSFSFDKIGSFVTEQKGEKVALIGIGDFFERAALLSKLIEKTFGFKPTVINPRYASHIDGELLTKTAKTHKMILTFESGATDGGFGQKIASHLGGLDVIVKNYGLGKKFYDRYSLEQVFKEEKSDFDSIINFIKNNI
ncbi:MAG: 1-deoxy-D-xylulose-5-phosphate synthase [Clostridia bacterium]|nr:1-deoxy-D-xylulose-5-phosphate synthase [Clostridia bacterium]